MDKSKVAAMMLEWENKKKELDILETLIEDQVLSYGETFVVGAVRATYNNGRKTYDYEKAGLSADPAIVLECSKTVVDWKLVCDEAKISIENIPVKSQTGISVSIKLDKEKE